MLTRHPPSHNLNVGFVPVCDAVVPVSQVGYWAVGAVGEAQFPPLECEVVACWAVEVHCRG